MEYDLTEEKDIKKFVRESDFKTKFTDLANQLTDPGTRFAADALLTDKYITGRDVQLAAFRHLNDLSLQGTDDFPYEYSQDYVNAIEYFTRILPNPLDLSQKIKPYGFESFLFDSTIGWRDLETGGSRFHVVHFSTARKQAKTFCAACLLNFGYFVIGLQGSAQDFLVASVDSEHVNKLFDYISLQARQIIALPQFANTCKQQDVEVQATQIVGHNNRNTVRKGTASGRNSFDSKHDLFAIFDEIGGLEPKYDKKVSDIMMGQGDNPNRLLVKISTAYPNPNCAFKHEEDGLRTAIETGSHDADDTFFLNFAQDSEDEVFNPKLWEKSNPLLHDEKTHDKRLTGLIDLKNNLERQGKLSDFANKSMNMWSRQFQDSYLALRDIQKNIIPSFDIHGRDVFVGIDASMTNDNTSFGLIFPYDKDKFHIEQYSFIPFAQAKTIEAKEKQDNLNYRELAEQGFCEITKNSSGTINYDQIWDWLERYISSNKLNLKAIVVDPAFLTWFAQRVESYEPEWPYIPFKQTSLHLNQPTKGLQKAYIDGIVTQIKDPLLIDGLTNAVTVTDGGGMIKIDRQNRVSQHIDTADAVINAWSQAQNYYEDFNDGKDVKLLDTMNQEQRNNYFKNLFGA